MRAHTMTLGGLTARVTGGTDGKGGGDGPCVVLLHGFGAPGEDLVPLGQALRLPPDVRFVFPAAPISFSMGYGESRAWWMIDMERLNRAIMLGEMRDLSREVPDGLGAARERVVALLDEVERKLGAAPERTVLGGFSQGAMLSCDVALRTDRPLGGLCLWSGTLIAEHEWTPRMASRAGLKVVQSHGRHDPLLPFSLAERLRDLLTQAGLKVDFVPFAGGHEIPGAPLAKLAELVRSLPAATRA
jgi:phospholipase/carboxylesterase